MSAKSSPTIAAKKGMPKDKTMMKSSSSLQELIDGDDTGKLWSTITRPSCSAAPQDNSFTLEDEGLVAVVESIVCGLTVSDPHQEDGPLLFVSPAVEKMTGFTVEELTGENLAMVLTRKKPEQEAVDAMRAAISARRFASVQMDHQRKDGKKFRNLLCLLPLLDGHAALKLYLNVLCDLERKEDRAAYVPRWTEQVQQHLKAFAITDNSQEHAPFIAVNAAFTALTGYGQEELGGCSVLSLGGPDTSKSCLKRLLTSHWTDKPGGVRMLCYRRDGSPFWGYVWNCPLAERSNGNGQCKRHLVLVFDITTTKLKRMGKFMLGKVIGQGASGIVYKGLNTVTDEVVAVKSVDASRFRSISEIEQMQEEMNVSASLKHPNIVRLFEVHFNSNVFYLVMELSSGGSLMQYIHDTGSDNGLEEADTHRLFVQMVSALDYCHRRRIIHRDLKPENILMDKDNNIKVADFGLSAISGFSSSLTLQCGTPEFSAPEISLGKEYEGTSIDIWSLGVILYEMLTGKLPFAGSTQALLFKSIQKGVYEPLRSSISEGCKDLLQAMLTTEPSRRITMDDIVHHPWLTGLADTTRTGAATTQLEDLSLAPASPASRAADAALRAAAGDHDDDMLEGTSDEGGTAPRATFYAANCNMHDSVKIILPNGFNRDDPIMAAMMRSQQSATADDDDIPSPPARGAAAGRGGARSGAAPGRTGTVAAAGGRGSAPAGAQEGRGRDITPSRLARAELSESRKVGSRSEVGAPPSKPSVPRQGSGARSDVGAAPPSVRNGGGAAAPRKPALPPLNTTSSLSPTASGAESKRPTFEVAKDMMSRGGRNASSGGTSPTDQRGSPGAAKSSPVERERRPAGEALSSPGSQPGTPPRSLPPLRRV